MSDSTPVEVLVIGGGLAGLAITYQLARRGASPLLVEAGSLFSGTSGACAGRAQVLDSHPGSYLELVLAGFNYLRTLGDELECDLEWREPGHLALIQTPQEWAALAPRVDDLCSRGIPAEMVAASELGRLEPELNPDGLLGAALSLEGHLNPFLLCKGLAQAARRRGARWITHSPVTGFRVQAGRVSAVLTATQSFSPRVVILACGAWTTSLLAQLGIALPLHFTQAEALITEPLPPRINHHVGMAGFYEAVHGKDRKVAFGIGQHANGTLFVSNAIQPAAPGAAGVQSATRSTAWALPALAQALRKLFPGLGAVRIIRAWSAASPFLPDYRPALGWIDLSQSAASNLYLAAGFHLAIPTIPLLATAIAAEVTGSETAVDLASFRPARWIEAITAAT